MFWVESAAASSFMPVQATDIAQKVDHLYGFLLIASLISCALVFGGFIYFAVKYKRRSDNDKTAYISHNNTLEFLWSFIPFVIFMVVFAWGWWIYDEMRTFPKDSLEIHVTGQKWYWDFTYKSGRKLSGEYYVPVNENVKMIITSKDVLHSVFIPGFRIKQDAVPGRYTALWFRSNKIGTFQMFCTEYCGDQHSAMIAKVHVVTKEAYEEWLRNDPYKGLELADIGKKVFDGRCVACHNTDSSQKVGPGFAGLFGKERKLADGSSVKADENYIRTSINNPNSQVVAGFPSGVMPTFSGQLSEQEITGVIEYIKTLGQ